jgi:hypothetical protein
LERSAGHEIGFQIEVPSSADPRLHATARLPDPVVRANGAALEPSAGGGLRRSFNSVLPFARHSRTTTVAVPARTNRSLAMDAAAVRRVVVKITASA